MAYACALIAQALTVAALSRAAYLAFYRHRPEPYDHLERPRAGMRASFILMAGACVGFGVLANPFVAHLASPAASTLLHPSRYAAAVLSSGGSVAGLDVCFDYFDVATMLTAVAEIVVGLLLAVWVVRRGQLRGLQWLRRLHTGSVNDYAGFAVLGLGLTAVVVLS